MKRGLVVALGGAAIIIAGLSGCSGDKASTGGAAGGTASTGGSAKASLDGKDLDTKGNVACLTTGSNVAISIGQPGAGIAVTLTSGDSPEVQAVAMGSANGGYAYGKGAPGGEAKATKDGSKYTITGKVTGVDMSNPTAPPATKPFEITVTCP